MKLLRDNKNKKFPLLLIIISTFLISSILEVDGNTIIGDSIFPAKETQLFLWRITYGNSKPYNAGDKFNFTVNSIGGGIYSSKNCLIVNASLDFFNSSGSKWTNFKNNQFYLAINKSQFFLNLSLFILEGYLFMIPLPINLTLVGESYTIADNYSITDNTIVICSWGMHRGTYTFNANGILTNGKFETNNELFFIMEYGDDSNNSLPPQNNENNNTISSGCIHIFLLILFFSNVIVIIRRMNALSRYN